MNQTVTFKQLPGVLSFKRGHVISDALMFNQLPEGETPLEVIRHGIRGTQNLINKNTAVSIIQINETAKLDPAAIAMIVRFELAFLPLLDALDACNGKNKEESQGVRSSINSFLERAKKSEGLLEVACRYARNIGNGRWLWRNRTIASDIIINVVEGNYGRIENEVISSFNALKLPMNHFESYTPEEIKLGEKIAQQMRGDSSTFFKIEAVVTMRVPGAEVFPSQNYIQNKPDGFARPLYKVGHPDPVDTTDNRCMGQAAMRDQKIFNAIRTIDTWYPNFAEEGLPIPIEPKGGSLLMQEFYRAKESSSFELFKRLNVIDPNSPDGMYCIASFDRGGVYSEKSEKINTRKVSEEGEK